MHIRPSLSAAPACAADGACATIREKGFGFWEKGGERRDFCRDARGGHGESLHFIWGFIIIETLRILSPALPGPF